MHSLLSEQSLTDRGLMVHVAAATYSLRPTSLNSAEGTHAKKSLNALQAARPAVL